MRSRCTALAPPTRCHRCAVRPSAGFGEFDDRQGGVGDGVCLVVVRTEHAEDLFGVVVDGGVVDQVGVGECQLQGGEQSSGDGGAGQPGLGGSGAAGGDACGVPEVGLRL